jgi:tRNA U34 5-carboxymethylaminomethyl modifying GTPase MnmE/TrmE
MWKNTLFKTLITIIIDTGLPKIPNTWKNIKKWWNGKCIAIIGSTASGKNSLFAKLTNEPPPKQHTLTRGTTKQGTFDFKWPLPDGSAIKFKCKKSINVGGEIDERERYWSDACKGADVIFYLIDAEKLSTTPNTTKNRIKDDFKWMISYIRDIKSNATIHILVNKIDLIIKSTSPDEITKEVETKFGSVIDEIQELSKNIFGKYRSRITGINAISMTDPYLFNTYFTEALKSISNLK